MRKMAILLVGSLALVAMGCQTTGLIERGDYQLVLRQIGNNSTTVKIGFFAASGFVVEKEYDSDNFALLVLPFVNETTGESQVAFFSPRLASNEEIGTIYFQNLRTWRVDRSCLLDLRRSFQSWTTEGRYY